MELFKGKRLPAAGDKPIRRRELILWLIVLIATGWAAVTLWQGRAFFEQNIQGSRYWYIFAGSLGFSLAYFIFLAVSALVFRKYPEFFDDQALPECTVLIPAYNEGRHVFDTILSVLGSSYPAEKLRIIAINDGSQDDTRVWLKKAEELFPQVSLIDLEHNQGKKHALYLGMLRAETAIIVTVDSDSIVRRDTLRNIVQPFADPRVGAVAGMITGKDADGNIHVRLLDVMLIFGCEFLRRAQSVCGNVFCTPGALSAYRKSAVMPLLDEWLHQRFCGRPAGIGEDRAIATLLLRAGHLIVHQPDARAETCLPESFCRVCKMLIRWTRSDIRENILMMPSVMRNLARPGIRSVNLFIHWAALFINMLLPLIFIPLGLYCLCTVGHICWQLAMITVSVMVWSMVPAVVFYLQKRSLIRTVWAFLFGFYASFALCWIAVYSLFSIGNSNWLTRELKHQ